VTTSGTSGINVDRAFLIERFADFLTLERGASPATNDAYGRDVTRFAGYAAAKGATGPADIAPRAVREFVYHLKDVGLAPSSISRSVSAVRTYYRFLLGDGRCSRSHRADRDSTALALPARGSDGR